MKFFYTLLIILTLNFTHISCMKHEYQYHNLFLSSDSESSGEIFDPMSNHAFFSHNNPSIQGIQKKSRTPNKHFVPKTKKIRIKKNNNNFWHYILHLAASVFGYHKIIIPPEKLKK